MSLHDKQVYESNLLAFKFSLIVQFFELLSTIVYQAGRVGIMNTVAMMIMQAIVIAATIVIIRVKRIFYILNEEYSA